MKVCVLVDHMHNNLLYEEEWTGEKIIKIFSSKEKALEFAKHYNPYDFKVYEEEFLTEPTITERENFFPCKSVIRTFDESYDGEEEIITHTLMLETHEVE